VKAPLGFKFSGLHAGIKPSRKDLALVTSDTPCAAAACFTVNKACAAPILEARDRLPCDDLQAIVINSGNANALTGQAGVEDVRRVLEALAAELKLPVRSTVAASTGVIGVRLPK
jgi:acetylglutamate kinase